MKRFAMAVLPACLCLLFSLPAWAMAILLEPPTGNAPFKIHAGETLLVNVNVSGLHSGVPDADVPIDVDPGLGPFRADSFLASFQFDFLYDPDLLAFMVGSSAPGRSLGVPTAQAVYRINASSPGIITLEGVSLLDESSLAALQSSSGVALDQLTLATFAFRLRDDLAPPVTTSRLETTSVVLSNPDGEEIPLLDSFSDPVVNAFGEAITATSYPETGFVRNEGASLVVGEPTSMSLLCLCAAACFFQLPKANSGRKLIASRRYPVPESAGLLPG